MTQHDDEMQRERRNKARKAFLAGFNAMRRGYAKDEAETAFDNWWAMQPVPVPPQMPKTTRRLIVGNKASRGPLRSKREWWEYEQWRTWG
jgi:hypothetical protein